MEEQGELREEEKKKGAIPKGTTSKGATSRGAIPKGATPKGATPKGATPKVTTSKGAIPKKPLRDVIKEKRQATKMGEKDEKAKMDEPAIPDPYQLTNDFKNVWRKPTAYGFIINKDHMSPWDINHPESSKRVVEIHEALHSLIPRMHEVEEPELVSVDDQTLFGYAHTAEYIDTVKELCFNGEAEDAQMYDSIFFNRQASYWSAFKSARMAVSVAKLVAEGKCQNGFANIRPPGHHATTTTPNGYCLFNNVAIAAKYLLHHKLAEKILIVDYDVHHGQGIQQMFYDTNKVLYFSIHRYEHGSFWPNLLESNYDFIGEREGEGYNINVPLNEIGIDDYDYLAIILNILLPIAYEFQPSIILVSAGYDACLGDPEGRMNVTPAFYGHLMQLLGGLAQGKIAVILEGGYFLPGLTECAIRTVRGLLNDPCSKVEYTKHINPAVREVIGDVKAILRPFWKCFHQFDHVIPVGEIYKLDKFGLNLAVKKFMGVVQSAPFPLTGGYPLNTAKQEQMFVAQLDFIREERYNMGRTRIGYMVNHHSSSHSPPLNLRTQEIHMRIVDILTKLREFNLIDLISEVEFEHTREDPVHPIIWDQVWEQIISTHSSSYILELRSKSEENRSDLYRTKRSRETCQWSVAVLCQLGIKITRGVIRYGIGIVRPPGHHAKHSEGGGFCLINNVVITANYLLRKRGFRKVLIIDFDVHHGDGTQELTYERNDIMYISMHRYDDGKFFPKDKMGHYSCIGEGLGAGYNVNIPFNAEKMDNVDYLQTWIKLVMPLSYAFNPDIILVSAGFDAAVNDPLGNYNVFPEVYGHFLQMLKPLGPIIVALEGGYNYESTSLGMVNCIRALLGQPLPMPPMGDAKDTTLKTIMNVIRVTKPYWPIMEVNRWVDTKEVKKRDDKYKDQDRDRDVAGASVALKNLKVSLHI